MIVRALDLLKQELELTGILEQSAELYAEVYDANEETNGWTESEIKDGAEKRDDNNS